MRIRSLTTAAALATVALATAGIPSVATASSGEDVYRVDPIMVKAPFAAPQAGARITISPAQCLAAYGFACQTPASIRAAYDIPTSVGGQPAGTGQTIVIVDAFGSPTVQQDLDTFSAAFGLPSTKVNVFHPVGEVAWHGTDLQNSWAGETSLDVQWAHAVAPGATIDLVVAQNSRNQVMNNALSWAVDNLPATTISMSYGSDEIDAHANSGQFAQTHAIFQRAAAKGITLFASSGDGGSDDGHGAATFSSPADDPLVTAVGGTTLFKGSGDAGPDETTWDDFTACPFTCPYGGFGATGGAPSLTTTKRGSDVAYDGSVYSGVLVFNGYYANPDDNGLYFTGGTSAGSPQWAGIATLLAQKAGGRIGNINPALASWQAAGALSDVTVGDNRTDTFTGGYDAGRGWDVPTGYGTPDVGRLLALS
jgi:subtilase family serine protease